MSLQSSIEAILFHHGEPIAITNLARLTEESVPETEKALIALGDKLAGDSCGIRLIIKDGEAMLATAPEHADLMNRITKEELDRDLSNAALETLAAVLYRGPLSKTEIDYIRGVNCQMILRTLLVRGLIERVPSAEDRRLILYRPTFDLLTLIGVSRTEELPNYEAVKEKLKKFEMNANEKN